MKYVRQCQTLVYIFTLCTLLSSCNTDIDLNNIDTSASLSTSIALPLGSMNIKLGDFIGDSTIQGLYVDQEGKYHYSHNIPFTHSVTFDDIIDKVDPLHCKFDIKEHIQAALPTYASLEEFTLPSDSKFTLTLPVTLSLKAQKEDLNYYRLDSLVMNYANFLVSVSLENIDLRWEDINNMTILIKDGFSHKDGKEIRIPTEGFHFDQNIPCQINNFHVVFMKDPQDTPSMSNMLDTIHMDILYDLHLSQPLTIKSNQYIYCDITLDTFEYEAIFGYIKEPKLLSDSVIDKPLYELWADWQLLDGMVLPIRKPSITFTIEHGLSIPLALDFNELSVSANDGTRKYATFDGAESTRLTFPPKIPLNSAYTTTTTDTILLDYTDTNGNIDELFTIHPDLISYNYNLGIDSTSSQEQYRITQNTDFHMNVGIDFPIEFNPNVHISYKDTIRDIDLSSLQLDSLLSEIEFVEELETAELQLLLNINNWIPFNISGSFAFYNASNQIVTLSYMEKESIDITIGCPTAINIGSGIVESPKETNIILQVKKEDFEPLASIKYIIFTAELGDNPYPAALIPNSALEIRAGVATNLKAIINMGKLFNQN